MMIATLTFQALAEWLLLAVGLASLHALILGTLGLLGCLCFRTPAGRSRVLSLSIMLGALSLPWAGYRAWDEVQRHPVNSTAAVSSGEASAPVQSEASTAQQSSPMTGEPQSSTLLETAPLGWRFWVAGAYLLGLGLMGVRTLAGALRTRGLRRGATPASHTLQSLCEQAARRLGLRRLPRVCLSAVVPLPVLLGTVRPWILLPASLASGLSPAQLDTVILHELAHLQRLDPLILALQRALETVLFFHPVVWMVGRQLAEERELACDDLVLESGSSTLDYAQAMMHVATLALPAERSSTLGLALGERRPSRLRRRVERVLDWQPRTRRSSAATLVLTTGLLVGFAGPMVAWPARAIKRQEPERSPREPSREGTTRPDSGRDFWGIHVLTNDMAYYERVDKTGGEQSWFPSQPRLIESQYVSLRRLELEPAVHDKTDFEVLVEFFYQGEEDEKRRILVDFTAKDAHQETLFHSWELTQDQRIGPELLDWGSRKVMRMPQNYSRFEIPAALQGRISSFEVRFREMQPKDYYHFPERPLKLDLRMTRPDSEGRFRLSFKAPEWWELPAEETGTAVVVLVPEGEGGELKRQSAHVLKHPEADGRYALSLQMKPDLVDRAQVSITFLEEIEPGFTRDHVAGDGQRTGYGGPWSAQTFSLLHVPFED